MAQMSMERNAAEQLAHKFNVNGCSIEDIFADRSWRMVHVPTGYYLVNPQEEP